MSVSAWCLLLFNEEETPVGGVGGQREAQTVAFRQPWWPFPGHARLGLEVDEHQAGYRDNLLGANRAKGTGWSWARTEMDGEGGIGGGRFVDGDEGGLEGCGDDVEMGVLFP